MATTMQTPEPALDNRSTEDLTTLIPRKLVRARPLFDPEILKRATKDCFVKLNPGTLWKNPVMFVVEVGAFVTTAFLIRDILRGAGEIGFTSQIVLWLWFTVLFANFAEAMAEARGKAQADSLRKTKTDAPAKKIINGRAGSFNIEKVPASKLRSGDSVLVEAGDLIPS